MNYELENAITNSETEKEKETERDLNTIKNIAKETLVSAVTGFAFSWVIYQGKKCFKVISKHFPLLSNMH